MGRGARIYILNLAKTIMGQIGFNWREINFGDPLLAKALYDRFEPKVRERIAGWSNETLGKVAGYGQSESSQPVGLKGRTFSLASVHGDLHGEPWLNDRSSGRELLLAIATAAIIAAMADVIAENVATSDDPRKQPARR